MKNFCNAIRCGLMMVLCPAFLRTQLVTAVIATLRTRKENQLADVMERKVCDSLNGSIDCCEVYIRLADGMEGNAFVCAATQPPAGECVNCGLVVGHKPECPCYTAPTEATP